MFNFTFSELVSWAAYSVDGRGNVTISNVYNWSGILSNLTDGPHNITVYAKDSSGYTNSTIRFWIRDTLQPSITIYSPKNTTYPYNNISLKVSAGENVHTWWYSLNGGSNTTFTPNTIITADEGFNELVIYANDTAGNIGYAVQYFTVDTTPPAIRIISPQNKSYSTGEIDYNLTAWEALNWSVVSIDDGTNITLGKLNDTYFYNLSGQHQSLTEGFHSATFYAQDLAGNFNSSTVYFTVDVTPPEVSFIDPTPPPYYNTSVPSITINVSHAELHPDTLILNWNGTNTSQHYGGSYTSIALSNLSDGRYSYYVWVNDTAGNANATGVRVVTIDTSPPEVTGITPTNGSGVKGVVTISVVATDRGTGVASLIATISNATYSQVLNLTYTGSGVWYNDTWNTSALAEGEYNITVNATDFIGWSSTTYVTVVVDRTEPASEVLSPLPNENISTTSYLIKGYAQDNESGVARVWVSVDGGSTWALANGTANWSYEWSVPGDGVYTITSRAEDWAGNTQTQLKHTTVTVDTTPPQIALLPPTPANGAVLGSGTTVIILNISIAEQNPDTLILSWNGANQSFNYSSGYVSITKSVASGKSYTFYLWANDTAGNVNATPAVTFSVAGESSTGGGTGGGGGAGGGISGGAKEQGNEVVIPAVRAGEGYRVYFRTPEAPEISDIEIFTTKDLFNTKLRVLTYPEKPEHLEAAPGETYRYFRIEYTGKKYLEKLRITFRVNSTWLEDNRINASSVVLYHLGEEWQPLETRKVKEALGYVYYTAEVEELSWFAVAGSKVKEVRVALPLAPQDAQVTKQAEAEAPPTREAPEMPGKEESAEAGAQEGEAPPPQEQRGVCAPLLPLLLALLAPLLGRLQKR